LTRVAGGKGMQLFDGLHHSYGPHVLCVYPSGEAAVASHRKICGRECKCLTRRAQQWRPHITSAKFRNREASGSIMSTRLLPRALLACACHAVPGPYRAPEHAQNPPAPNRVSTSALITFTVTNARKHLSLYVPSLLMTAWRHALGTIVCNVPWLLSMSSC